MTLDCAVPSWIGEVPMHMKQPRSRPFRSPCRKGETPRLLACPTTRKEPRSRVTPFAGESDPHPVNVVSSARGYASDSRAEGASRGGSIGFQAVPPVALSPGDESRSAVAAEGRVP